MRSIFLIVLFFFCNFLDSREKYDPAQFAVEKVEKGKFVFLKHKHVEQLHYYCVPASVSMVLDYYGHKTTQKTMAMLMSKGSRTGKGTYFTDAITTVEKLGFDWKREVIKKGDFDKDFQKLKDELDNKRPVLLGLEIGKANHAVVLIGYDEKNKIAFTIDPFTKNKTPYVGAIYYTYKDLDKIWKQGFRHRDYVLTKASDKKQEEVVALTKDQVLSRNKEVLAIIRTNMLKSRRWGLLPEYTKDIKSIEADAPIDVLKASEQSKSSDLRKFFQNLFQEYLESQYSNNQFPIFLNQSFLCSVLEYDSKKKSYNVLCLDRKTMKLEEITLKEYKLKEYLAMKVRNNKYALYSYQFRVIK